MTDKIIDFNKSKEKYINDKFQNVDKSNLGTNKSPFYKSNKAFEKFQDIFVLYEKYINDESDKEVSLDEVLIHFNKYFEALYYDIVICKDKRMKNFKEMMDYAVLSGGKRLRPFLMFMTYYLCKGKDFMILAPFMVAIELIHTFSLVHDDLPCMDNDELRRGKPTVWKKYGYDMAVLVGDALMIEAVNVLNDVIFELGFTMMNQVLVGSALVLTRLTGLEGMMAGQVFDVQNTTNKDLTKSDIKYMYQKKTTALITASIMTGANLSLKVADRMVEIEGLAECLGEIYQIQDDLLEIEKTTEEIGKSANSDKERGKVTYVSLNGIDESKKHIDDLYMKLIKYVDSLALGDNEREMNVFMSVIDYILARQK